MAKSPRPGRVKTRLVAPGGLSADAAADMAAAMLRCVADRVRSRGRLVLAVSPIGDRKRVEDLAGPSDSVVDQGAGDLGRRMEQVWEQLNRAAPIAFLGIDSPDVPETALEAIPHALKTADIAVGPTDDGGYWTLAARGFHPEVLRDIDWGSATVYDSTCRQAATAGLVVRELQTWFDVDDPADLAALRARLKGLRTQSGPPESRPHPALDQLAAELDAVCLVCRDLPGCDPDQMMTYPPASESSPMTPYTDPQRPDEIDLSDASVLLVDDNLQNLELMQAYLESLPCRIRTAKDGVEAAALIEEEIPDLMLLDVMMPRMSGFELCQKIKSNPDTRDIVVIMVTALHEVGDFERAVECGTNDFITKPVNKLELVTRVKSLLELSLVKQRYDQMLGLTQRRAPDQRNRPDAGQKLE